MMKTTLKVGNEELEVYLFVQETQKGIRFIVANNNEKEFMYTSHLTYPEKIQFISHKEAFIQGIEANRSQFDNGELIGLEIR